MNSGNLRNKIPVCKVIKKSLKNREQQYVLPAKWFVGLLNYSLYSLARYLCRASRIADEE